MPDESSLISLGLFNVAVQASGKPIIVHLAQIDDFLGEDKPENYLRNVDDKREESTGYFENLHFLFQKKL